MPENTTEILEHRPQNNRNDFLHNEPSFNNTKDLIRRIKDSPFFEEPAQDSPNGFYQNRRIIGKDVPINGGVYMGSGPREAIVVDDTKQEILLKIYSNFVNANIQDDKNYKSNLLKKVFETTMQVLPYDLNRAEGIAKKVGSDNKVGLDIFINERAGVCRHQALLAGYLLEKLKKDGYVNGNVSVDRNYIEGKGGHAWVRYTNSQNEVFIIDPTQKYIGRLADVPSDRWFYQRPEDREVNQNPENKKWYSFWKR